MQTAQLEIVKTSANCIRYRLVVDGKRVWSNRVFDVTDGHAGARARMAAWALAHQYRVELRQAVEQAQVEVRSHER